MLKSSTDTALLDRKYRLLDSLRAVDVFVLERGAIEDYYPSTISGADKPSQAMDFCKKVATRDEILGCCGEQPFDSGGATQSDSEFNLIFERIFERTN